jgi:rubrerythrin
MLKGSETEQNLLKAFAGESQARNRYSMYASIARKEGYEQIANIFLETASNEYEHAKLFYRHLKGNEVKITASYPAGVIGDTIVNLEAAANGEGDEADALYPEFAKIAAKEGFTEISELFTNIAKIEKQHQNRYLKLLENVKNNKIFIKDEEQEWVCLECGYIHHGKEAPKVCPVCAHPQAFYQLNCKNY